MRHPIADALRQIVRGDTDKAAGVLRADYRGIIDEPLRHVRSGALAGDWIDFEIPPAAGRDFDRGSLGAFHGVNDDVLLQHFIALKSCVSLLENVYLPQRHH